MWINRFFLSICIVLVIDIQLFAQLDSIYQSHATKDGSAFSVTLDAVVISDFKKGINIPFFIQKMQEDESFYRAFKNTRFASYNFKNKVQFKYKPSPDQIPTRQLFDKNLCYLSDNDESWN